MSEETKFLRPEVVNMLQRKKKIEEQSEKLNHLERQMIETSKVTTYYLQAQDRKMKEFNELHSANFRHLLSQFEDLRFSTILLSISALVLSAFALLLRLF